MARRRTNYEDFYIEWDPDARTMKIIPKHPNATVTPKFGLGNAVIQFNLDHPPKKIVRRITGDSDAGAITPYSIVDMRKWAVSIGDLQVVTKQLPKSNKDGETTYYPITIPLGNKFHGEELANDVDIKKNGIGQWRPAGGKGRISF